MTAASVSSRRTVGKRRLHVLLAVLAGLLLVAVAWWWLSREHVESAEDLAQLALAGNSPEAQEQAAARLEALAGRLSKTGTRNAAQPHLSRLLAESKNPGVRAASMRGLASIWDYQNVPAMLDLLDDESSQVRQAAARSIESLISADNTFDANAAPESRRAAAKRLREMWRDFTARSLKSWQQRLETKDGSS